MEDEVKISVCIPMYNEASIIEETAKSLFAYMENSFGTDYEIVFSDDGSTDGTSDIVRALGLPPERVRVIGYPDNRGKGSAVREAVLASRGDIIMFTDADLAYGTDVIKRICDALEADETASLAIGSRNLASDGYDSYTFVRKLASKAYIKVLGIVGGFKLSDSQCGCKAYRADAGKRIFSECRVNGFAFDFETILRAQKAGLKIIEVPVRIINHRESKIHIFRDTFRMLGDLRRIKKDVYGKK